MYTLESPHKGSEHCPQSALVVMSSICVCPLCMLQARAMLLCRAGVRAHHPQPHAAAGGGGGSQLPRSCRLAPGCVGGCGLHYCNGRGKRMIQGGLSKTLLGLRDKGNTRQILSLAAAVPLYLSDLPRQQVSGQAGGHADQVWLAIFTQ